MKEKLKENCNEVVQELFTKLGVGPFDLQRCHRIGRYDEKQKKPRRMIIRFTNYPHKQNVMEKRGMLKGTNIYINDDYPIELERKRGILRPVLKYVKQADQRATLVQDKLRFKGKLYTTDTVAQIPMNIASLGIKETDSHVLFAGRYTPLSNFYPCKISNENHTFTSSEHMFQFERTTAIGDHTAAAQILVAPSPIEAMIIGRNAKTDRPLSLTEEKSIMTKVITLKIQQVPQLLTLLKTHAGKTFAEATNNITWGTGIPMSSPLSTIKDKWTGKNFLGQIYCEQALFYQT